jgi:hypothetical protein
MAGIVLVVACLGAQAAPAALNVNAPITAPPPPPPSTATATAHAAAGKPPLATPRSMTIAVVGDSVAATMVWGLDDITKGTPVHVVSTAFPGCGVAAGIVVDKNGRPFPWSRACNEHIPLANAQMINEWNPKVVLWSSTWEISDRLDLTTKRILKYGSTAGDAALYAAIDAAAHRLTARGAHLVLLTVAPRAPSDVAPADGPGGTWVHYNEMLRRYAAAHPRTVSVLDIMPFLCPSGAPCPAKVDGVVLRPDGGHFTQQTAPIVARWLLPRLETFAPQ